MDKVAYKTPPKSSLKRMSSLTRAEAIETARSCEQKRNTFWVDPEGNRIHNTQSETGEVRNEERVALPIEALRQTGKITSFRKRSTHKTKGVRMNHSIIKDEISEETLSSDKNNDFIRSGGNSDGKDKPISNDTTVDHWCKELAGVWAANARRENLEADIRFESYNESIQKKPRLAQKDRGHKARIVGMTMMVEGKDEPKKASITTTSNKTDLSFKGKTIDEILLHLENIKNDPSIPMPIIEADKATLNEFMKYLDGHPNAESIKTMYKQPRLKRNKIKNVCFT